MSTPNYGPKAIMAPRDMPGLLPDHLIRDLIPITPFSPGVKRPGIISYGLSSIGYDVRLARKFMKFNSMFTGIIDPKKVDPEAFTEFEGDYCDIPAGGYVLGESVEKFTIPRDIGVVCIGKSTYARIGVTINVTPGEPEWEGIWTIEIENAAPVPVRVYANEGIFQALFFRTVTECEQSYKDKGGKYQGDAGIRLAKVD